MAGKNKLRNASAEMKLKCPKCNKMVDLQLSDSGPHIKASCVECGRYIKFISPKELQGENIMSNFEVPFKVEGSEYNEVVLLEKYGDRYSIGLGQEARNGGTIYKRWCYPQRRVDGKNVPSEKGIPIRITLGDRNSAVTMLRGMLAIFENPQADPVPNKVKDDDEEPPF